MTSSGSKAIGIVLFGALATTSAAGCSSNDNKSGTHDIWFNGTVIDGVTSTPLTAYTINLVWAQKTIKGKVDASGRFSIGPLPAWNDYGIVIEAGPTYRAFSSFNSGIAPPAPPASSQGTVYTAADIYTSDTTQTFNFDAYLFPTSVMAPDVSITVLETGVGATSPSGSIRLQPTTLPSIQAGASEIAGQVWGNDNDLFAGVVNDTFSNGTYTAAGAQLLYGVNYSVTVFGVEKYQPGTGSVQAGYTNQALIPLMQQSKTPLAMLQNDANTCIVPLPTSNAYGAKINVTFNQPIQFVGTAYAELFDNAFNAVPGTGTGTTSICPLKNGTIDATMQERGTKVEALGNVISFSWNPANAWDLSFIGCSVPTMVNSVTYGIPSNVMIMPMGGDAALDGRALTSLGLTTALSCNGH
jgi:hypothetical protein